MKFNANHSLKKINEVIESFGYMIRDNRYLYDEGNFQVLEFNEQVGKFQTYLSFIKKKDVVEFVNNLLA